MWCDAAKLREFYAGNLGRTAQRMIGQAVREVWPDVSGDRILGIGYATPFLGPFRATAERVTAAMPAAQGVHAWPQEGACGTALVDEANLPFPDRMFDRVLIVHALECAEPLRPMLREIWRVMADGGRLLVVVPNQRGLWARFQATPFGKGAARSESGVRAALREVLFQPERSGAALFLPPVRSRMVIKSATAWETVGRRLFKTFGGVVLVEATKQVYAGRLVFANRDQEAAVPSAVRTPIPR